MAPIVQDKEKDKELTIRRAKSTDAARIAVLSGQLGYPATTAQMRKRLLGIKPDSQHGVFVAESAKEGVLGWGQVSRQPLLEVEIRAEENGLALPQGHRSGRAAARLLPAPDDCAGRHDRSA